MRKVLTMIVIILMVSVNSACAYEINKMSTDSKIVSALKVLENNGMTDVLTRIEKSGSKIMFYDLTLISYSYSNHYAVATTDENGENYILINSNLQRSPKEALACLIAHESVHELAQATYEEEVKATTTEAKAWEVLKDNVTGNYDNDKLVKRLNKLVEMNTTGSDKIANAISNSSFYQTQLAK